MNLKDSLTINTLWLCEILWLTIILISSASCSSKESSNKRPRRRRPRPPGQAAPEGSKEEAKKDSKEQSKEPLASCEIKEKKDKGKVAKDDEKKEEDTQVASLSPQNPLLGELADTQDFLENDEIKATQGED